MTWKDYDDIQREISLKFDINEKKFLKNNDTVFLKNIIDIYIEVYLNENFTDDHGIFDRTYILISNYPSQKLIAYLKNKIKDHYQIDLIKDLDELINLIKINI